MFIKQSIRQKIFLLVITIIILSVGCYTTFSIYYTQKTEVEEIDNLLLSAAYGAQNIIGDSYHDAINDSMSISAVEYDEKIKILADFANKLHVKEIYSYINYKGELRWTSGSLEEDTYFSKYEDDQEIMNNVYLKPFRDNKPSFCNYEDMYGSVRSVLIPFKTASGKSYIIGVDYSQDYIKSLINKMILWHITFGLCLLILAIFVAYFLINRISKPLKSLVNYTNELISNNFQLSEKSQDLLNIFSLTYKDEVGKLSGAFLSMQISLKQYIVDLRNTTIAKESMEGQLRIANAIQMGMIPKGYPTFPNQSEFNILGYMSPAKEVGGDLFNYFMIDETHLGFTIGDVSDKGIPAALFMAMTNTLIKAIALTGLSPAEVLAKANNELCKENEECMFVTLLFGILNIKTGEVEFSNAGHNPFILLRNNNIPEYMKMSSGMVLAAFKDFCFVNERIVLKQNDTIILYTDGITEAMNNNQELFGEQRLLELIKELHVFPIPTLIEETIQGINKFVDGNEQSDDITILVLRYHSQHDKNKIF